MYSQWLELMKDKIYKAIGFIDWNTAVIASGASTIGKRHDRIAEIALRHIEKILSDYLILSSPQAMFRVQLRLYAGWWTGRTPTGYRRGIDGILTKYAKRVRHYRKKNRTVIFQAGSDGLQLGERLACVNKWLTQKEGVHFLDTMRSTSQGSREKMVDTALTTDLIGLVHRKEADQYVVISDDDDILAGIIYSECMGANIKMLSRCGRSSKYMAHIKNMLHIY